MIKEQRVLFHNGEQRKFLDLVVEKLNCVSIRGILQFGFDINYSTLKSYYIERRLIPRSLLNDLCYISKIDAKTFKIKYLNGNWGQVKGGKVGKR